MSKTAKIKLTKGFEAIVDAEDLPLVALYKWQFRPISSKRDLGTGYATAVAHDANGVRFVQRMHRLVMMVPKGLEVDHINGNGLDNRKCNLRFCTRSQNQFNKAKTKRFNNPFKGVSLHLLTGKYQAYISAHGTRHHLGLFKTPEDALAARLIAAGRLHGEFARVG